MSDKRDTDSDVREIKFHYQKGNNFRVIHADGAWGGVSPTGFLHFAIYNERGAIPQETAMKIADGKSGEEKIVKTIGGFVREVEADVIMDLNAAVNFHIWMKGKLEIMRKNFSIPDEDWEEMLQHAEKKANSDD